MAEQDAKALDARKSRERVRVGAAFLAVQTRGQTANRQISVRHAVVVEQDRARFCDLTLDGIRERRWGVTEPGLVAVVAPDLMVSE